MLCLIIIIPFVYFLSLLKVRNYLKNLFKKLLELQKITKFNNFLELEYLQGFL